MGVLIEPSISFEGQRRSLDAHVISQKTHVIYLSISNDMRDTVLDYYKVLAVFVAAGALMSID